MDRKKILIKIDFEDEINCIRLLNNDLGLVATESSGLFLLKIYKRNNSFSYRKFKLSETEGIAHFDQVLCLAGRSNNVLLAKMTDEKFGCFDLKKKKLIKIWDVGDSITHIKKFRDNLYLIMNGFSLFLFDLTQLWEVEVEMKSQFVISYKKSELLKLLRIAITFL